MRDVLVVDNDQDILDLLSLGLRELGHTVRTASSGVEALRAIETAVPEVLITDLVMPNISGEKLLEIVRAVPQWSSIQTIVLSGVAAEAPALRARIRCDIYIAKGPISATLKYLADCLDHFEKMTELGQSDILGLDGIYSRHITRELLEFKGEVDLILDNISEGICRINQSLELVWINRAFARLMGRSEPELLGRQLAAIFQPFELDSALLWLQDSSRRDRPLEITLDRHDGSRVVRAELLDAEEPDYPFTTILWRDVTDQLLSEERYENIVESAGDMVCAVDTEGNLTYVSRSSMDVLGFTREQMINRPIWDFVASESLSALQKDFQGCIESGGAAAATVSVRELELNRADGQPRVMEIRVTALRDRADRTLGIRLVLSDVTARHQLEREREHLLHEINHRVRNNLQLLVSLARIGGTEHLQNRIETLGEVFDELYREKSFSQVQTWPLLDRILRLAPVAAEFESNVPFLSMKVAVPLSLFIIEIIRKPAATPGDPPRVQVKLLKRTARSGRVSMILTIQCGDPEADATVEPIDSHSIAGVLVQQLRGRGRRVFSPAGEIWTVRFTSENL